MSLARLVVIEGPDAGREFELPLRGGVVGRGEGSLVQLTDPTVSRNHGEIELRDGALHWIDDSEKVRTLINGRPARLHPLAADDVIVLGGTRMRYLLVETRPTYVGDGISVTQASSHVTREINSRAVFSLLATEARASRYLGALAQLGDRLRSEAGRDAAARATCDAALSALGARRAFVLTAGRRVTPIAAATLAGESTQLQTPQDLLDRVIGRRQIMTAETERRALVAAPITGAGDDVLGLVWVDREGTAWEQIDAQAVGCLAQLLSAAWVASDAREQAVRRADALEEQLGGAPPSDIVGKSEATQRVNTFVKRVAPSDATVLLGGESGAGKEMVARAIHNASRRAKGPCVAVNCAALTESLIESELFGHEKGAFTGATEKKAGRFEMADKGTLFLDEVGELPLGLQTKFLRVLEERRFERVGGQKSIEVDVRVVAATNRDLHEMVRRGTFREDLYYRLSVIAVEVPPLRARLDDVPLLAEHFLARFRHQAGRRVTGFAPDALAAMTRYAWPGNVRELRNAVERAVVLGDGEKIIAADLPPHVLSAAGAPRTRTSSPTPPLGSAISAAVATLPPPPPVIVDAPPLPPPLSAAPAIARSLRELEKDGILAALAATGGNKAQAASILEIDRSTLYKKLKDYGIES